MPLDRANYIELEKKLKTAYLKKAKLVELSGDVYRVHKDELPSPTTSEMVSTIPKQYSKARSRCHYSVGQSPSAYLYR